MRESSSPAPAVATSPAADRVKLALSWLIVGVPAAWAVTQVVAKTLALFH